MRRGRHRRPDGSAVRPDHRRLRPRAPTKRAGAPESAGGARSRASFASSAAACGCSGSCSPSSCGTCRRGDRRAGLLVSRPAPGGRLEAGTRTDREGREHAHAPVRDRPVLVRLLGELHLDLERLLARLFECASGRKKPRERTSAPLPRTPLRPFSCASHTQPAPRRARTLEAPPTHDADSDQHFAARIEHSRGELSPSHSREREVTRERGFTA